MGAETGLLLLCLFLFFWHLGEAPLLDYDEALYVTCAQQMTLSGDIVTPRLNTRMPERPGVTAVPFFEKPILVYWVATASMRLFGHSVWAARLPAALTALLTTAAVYGAGRRWFGRRAGLLSALIYATAPMTLVDARQMTTDGLLVLWLTIALLCFAAIEGIGNRREEEAIPNTKHLNTRTPEHLLPAACFWLMCALAVLTKGAVGLLLPFMIIGVASLWKRLALHVQLRTPAGPRLRFVFQIQPLHRLWTTTRRLYPLVGLLLFLVVAAPWHVLIARSQERDAQGRTWVAEYVLRQHIGRFKGLDTVHNAPLPTYFVYFLLGFFPWACFAPAAFRYRGQGGTEEEIRRQGEGENRKAKGKSEASHNPQSGRPPEEKDTIGNLEHLNTRTPEHPNTQHPTPNTQHPTSFLLVWFWTIFIFFSVGAAKLPTYITPAYPAAALLLGRWLDSVLAAGKEEGEAAGERRQPKTGRSLQRGALGALTVGLLLLIGVAFAPRFAPKSAPIPAGLLTMGWHLALTFTLGSALAWAGFRRTDSAGRRYGIGALAAMMVIIIGFIGTEGAAVLRSDVLGPYQQLAVDAAPDARAGIPILYYHIVPRRPSMNYYAGYAPFEHKETLVLPFLAACLPPQSRQADILLTRDNYIRLLQPEIASVPGASESLLRQRGPRGEWVLARVTLPTNYVPPPVQAVSNPLWKSPQY